MLRSTLLVIAVVVSAGNAAAEEPQVIRRDGQVCVQTRDAQGAVSESCRPDRPITPAPSAATEAAQAPAATQNPLALADARRSASLLESDPHGAARGIGEYLGAQVGAAIPMLVYSVVALTSRTDVGGLLAATLVSFGVSSLTAGLFHIAIDGQAGIGWAFLGNLVGQVGALLLTLLLGTSPVGSLIAAVVGSVLPALGASVALELRDTALRKEGTMSAARPPQEGSIVVSRF